MPSTVTPQVCAPPTEAATDSKVNPPRTGTGTVLDVSVPSPYTPLGTRGKGEGVPGPVPAALANAVSDAVGARVTTLPMTAQRVWEAMRAAAP